MIGGYYEIDDIIAEAENIPCLFNIDAVKLGYLDDAGNEDDLAKDTRIELPYWLTQVLTTRNMVTVELPKCFTPRFKTALLADPAVVDLRDRQEFFYELGTKLSTLSRDPEISDMLQKTLSVRYLEILKRHTSWRSMDFTSFTSRLANMEAKLFQLKSEGLQNQKSSKLEASALRRSKRRRDMR